MPEVKELGECECPCCGLDGAKVRESKKTKAYVVCGDCGYQGFARGEVADKKLRARIGKKAEPKPSTQQPQPKETDHDESDWLRNL